MRVATAGCGSSAAVLFGLIVLGVVVRAFLNAANAGARSDLETGTAFDVLLLVFPAVGLVLVTKRPRNVLGWLMIAIGMGFVMTPGRSVRAVCHDHP